MAEEFITPNGVKVPLREVELSAMRASGAGGQHVNKVSSAVHLKFFISASTLPERVKDRLQELQGSRVSKEGALVIKAQNHRTQERNRRDALERLGVMIDEAFKQPARRVPTRPSRSARARRVNAKKQRGQLKKLRGKVED